MNQQGFTLLETLMSLAIISVLFGMTIPIYLQFQTRNDADISVRTFVSAARRAQQLAESSDNGTSWGVKYAAGTITIYRGATDATGAITYATRTSSADDTLAVPSSVAPTGTSEIDFNYLTGTVSTTPGTLTLTNGTQSRTVTFNAKGMIDWN